MKTFDVKVYWREEHEFDGMFATVAIAENWEDNDDNESIFFYFHNEAEYREFLLNGTDEFRIEEVA